MSEAAEQRENGFSLAGLAQVGDASDTFGLYLDRLYAAVLATAGSSDV